MNAETPPGIEHTPVGREPVEAVLARHTAARAVWVAPVLIGVFWLTRGADGALWSAVGVAVVVGNFLVSGWMLSAAARISYRMYHAAALIGFLLRLGLIVTSVVVLVSLVDLDRLAFGIAALASYMVLLTWETVQVARGRERELDWAR